LNNKNGFTLVEILVAATLLITVLSAFSLLIKQAKESALYTRKYTGGIYQLRSQMERIRGSDINELQSMNGASFADGAGKIWVRQLSNDLISVDLELKWAPGRPGIHLLTFKGDLP
jgi:Tfp pilus assembly protein PilV